MRSMSESRLVMSDSLWPYGLYSPWDSPGQSPGVGSLFLLQGIFPTQGLNQGLLHCRRILYQLSHQGSTGKGEVSELGMGHKGSTQGLLSGNEDGVMELRIILSPPVSSVHGIFQARVQEWGAIAFSNNDSKTLILGFVTSQTLFWALCTHLLI